MKVAILGSRDVGNIDLDQYFPKEIKEQITEVVSGGARGVDTCAREWARKHRYSYKEFLPDYARYRRGAPLKRNQDMINYCDCAVFYWDGKSRGTRYTIKLCKLKKKLHFVYRVFWNDEDDSLLMGFRIEGRKEEFIRE